ncbi:MAG TPA: hypothetical protein VN924_17930 [Bryobacteraceae bacterium]|nr:hypothetical protein [Bryobacteraceae bacterium]
MKAFWITTLALACVGSAIAQDVPPPPPMRGDAATLQDTMKFIQDKLPGKVNYILYIHDNVTGIDGTLKGSLELTNVSADAGRCRIDDHWRMTQNGETRFDEDGWVDLRQVQEILVMPMDQRQQQVRAKAGHPEQSVKVDPPVFVLILKRSDAIKESNFKFYDETLANRVAKALQHAVDLCGGGRQEPF